MGRGTWVAAVTARKEAQMKLGSRGLNSVSCTDREPALRMKNLNRLGRLGSVNRSFGIRGGTVIRYIQCEIRESGDVLC